jgi:hypothetical protein
MRFLQLVHGILKGGLVPLIVVRSEPWRSILQVSREDGLRSIDHEERRETCHSVRGCPQTLEDRGEFYDPSVAKFVQPVEDHWLEALQDHAVGALNLPVRPRLCHGCPIHTDMVIITKI